MSNIIILSLLSLGLVTSFSFIYSVKKEFKFVEFSEIEGSELLTTKTLDNVGEFHSISTSDQMKVVISQGPSSIEISAEDNLIDFIKVDNRDGTLEIKREFENGQNVRQKLPMIIRVSNPHYESLKSRNQSEIIVEGSITSDEITISLRDQSNFKGEFACAKIELDLKQQSNANLYGSCEEFVVEMWDQAGIRTTGLEANNVEINMSNQTDASVKAISSIKGGVSDNAGLSIKGNPQSSQITKSRMASVSGD